MAGVNFAIAIAAVLQTATMVASIQMHDVDQPLGPSVTKGELVRAKAKLRAKRANHTETELERHYKAKAEKLKEMMEVYWEAKEKMEHAKREASEAKHLMQDEAARLAREEAERLAKIEAERQARVDSQRRGREAAIEKAEEVIAGAVANNETSILSGIETTRLVDVLLALPGAVNNERFSSTVSEAVNDMQGHVKEFLNITNKKTAAFVSAAQSASDAELAYSMAKFFHESVYRLKSLHKQSLLVVLKVKKVMPDTLRKTLTPIVTQLSSDVVTLKVNASELAKGSLGDACDSVSQIMGNISDYDSKLMSMNEGIENATAHMLPMMDRIMPVSKNVTVFVQNFISIAKMETEGLQAAAHNIATQVGPLVTDRVHCTWSGAPSRFGFGVLSVVASFVAIWSIV